MCVILYDDCRSNVQTWVLVLVIVIFILCCIGAAYTCWLRDSDEALEEAENQLSRDKSELSELSNEIDMLPEFDDEGNIIRSSSVTTLDLEMENSSVGPALLCGRSRGGTLPELGRVTKEDPPEEDPEAAIQPPRQSFGLTQEAVLPAPMMAPPLAPRDSLDDGPKAGASSGGWASWIAPRRCCY